MLSVICCIRVNQWSIYLHRVWSRNICCSYPDGKSNLSILRFWLSLIGWCHLQSYRIELIQNQTAGTARWSSSCWISWTNAVLSGRPDKPAAVWAAPCSSLRSFFFQLCLNWRLSPRLGWRVWKQSHSQVKGGHTGMHDEVKQCVQGEKQFDQCDEHFQTVIPLSRRSTARVRSTNNKWLQCQSLLTQLQFCSRDWDVVSYKERPSWTSLKLLQTFHLSGLYYWQTVN